MVAFGPQSKWSNYSWNDIAGLLIKAGWNLKKDTGSSAIRFTPRPQLHSVIGSHSVSIHAAHKPSKRPVPEYCVKFLKLAFKNSYGITDTEASKNIDQQYNM